MIDKMFKKASEAMLNAYAPYSKYQVGACLLSEHDKLFSGCNVENVSYGLTMCAERVAMGNLVAAGEKRIKAVLVMSSGDATCTPCGACRQCLLELAVSRDIPVYLCNNKKYVETVTLGELLPKSFGPDHLEK